MHELRFARALFATTFKASLALRGAFLLQASFMLLNNLMFFSTWWILLRRFGSIRGFTLSDMLALYGISVTGYGIAMVFGGGVLELARAIADGDLDALMSQPKNVLLRAVASRSIASGWGDVATGIAMLATSGYVGVRSAPWAVLAVAIAAITLIASCVLLHSSAFWFGRVQDTARMLVEFVITFCLYPPTLFGAGIKAVLFTLLPAGIIAFLPLELIRHPRADTALLALGASALYCTVAYWVFQRGLRRYCSGSRFGVWG